MIFYSGESEETGDALPIRWKLWERWNRSQCKEISRW